MIQLGKGWYLYCLLSFLFHPPGFKLNNNPICVVQMCENNSQGEWNFLVLKIPQKKGNRESNDSRHDLKHHPAWSSCVIFRWSLEQSKDFNATSAQRGYPDEWMWRLEISTKEMRGLYIYSHLGLLFDLALSHYLVFRTICWLWSWNITCSRVGRKYIGSQGQCTVSFPRFICLDLSQWQLKTGSQRKALAGQRVAWEINQAVVGTIRQIFNRRYNLLYNFSKLHILLHLLSIH